MLASTSASAVVANPLVASRWVALEFPDRLDRLRSVRLLQATGAPASGPTPSRFAAAARCVPLLAPIRTA